LILICCGGENRALELVEGLAFHKFYFDHGITLKQGSAISTTISSPKVTLLGDGVAVVAYARLLQVYLLF
jgi:hypothetical protein